MITGKWTEEETTYLIQHSEHQQASEIAKVLNRSISSVFCKQNLLGINGKKKFRGWTEEELAFLQDNWGTQSMKMIAKSLNRTIYAVRQKAIRLGLGDARMSFNGITVGQLATALGLDYSYVKNWIKNFNLPIKYKRFVSKEKVKVITYKDFWKWAEVHKHMINFSIMEPLVLGPEPEWMKEKRKADFLRSSKKRWTEEETKTLLSMLQAQTYTYSDIAAQLRRSESAIKKKIRVLKTKLRPVYRNYEFYTNDEMNTVVDMYNKGYELEVIGRKLNKSALGIRTRLERSGYKFQNKILIKVN